MLVDPSRSKAVVLRFAVSQLPCFSFWKNSVGPSDGYVVGLEPGTNFPHPLPYEKAHHRVVPLGPGDTHVAETTLEILNTPEAVAGVLSEVQTRQQAHPPTIHLRPTEPFAPED